MTTKLDFHKQGLWRMVELDLQRQQDILTAANVENPMPKLIALYAPKYKDASNLEGMKNKFDSEVSEINNVPRLKLYAVNTFGATYQGKCLVDAEVVECFGKKNRKGQQIFDPLADECYQNQTDEACKADARCKTTGNEPTRRTIVRNGDQLTIDDTTNVRIGSPIRFKTRSDKVKSLEGNSITFHRFNASWNTRFPGFALPFEEGENIIVFPKSNPSCKKKMMLPLYGRLPR